MTKTKSKPKKKAAKKEGRAFPNTPWGQKQREKAEAAEAAKTEESDEAEAEA